MKSLPMVNMGTHDAHSVSVANNTRTVMVLGGPPRSIQGVCETTISAEIDDPETIEMIMAAMDTGSAMAFKMSQFPGIYIGHIRSAQVNYSPGEGRRLTFEASVTPDKRSILEIEVEDLAKELAVAREG